MLAVLNRGIAMMDLLEKAGDAHGIDPALLAAIPLKESNFTNKSEVDGAGVGVGIFQITVSAGSGITAQQASDPAWAANWAAKTLTSNMTLLAAKHPNFTGDVLLQATAASYNLGPNAFSGDPDKIDIGSKGTPKDAYGANVMQLMECFR
jgi:soluble lytic murein transglycosylase-like protein